MLITIIILVIVCGFLGSCLFISVNKNLDQQDSIDTIRDMMQESINHLNNVFIKVEAKTKLEVMSDDPIVRDLVNDIRDARDTLKYVLDSILTLATSDDRNDETYEDEEEL